MPMAEAMEHVLGKKPAHLDGRYDHAFKPLAGSTPVTLAALDKGMCKWPIGENPTLFCGLDSTTGRYCPDHERMSGVRLPAIV